MYSWNASSDNVTKAMQWMILQTKIISFIRAQKLIYITFLCRLLALDVMYMYMYMYMYTTLEM
jgi:cell division protein FtsL